MYMSITSTKIKAPQNKHLKGAEYDGRPYPEGLFKPHFQIGYCGRSGSGKSNSMMIALLEYQNLKTFDKMILISPSANEDPKYDRIDWTERYEDYDTELIKDIVEAQKEDIEEYKLYIQKLKIYEKFIKSKTLKNFNETEKKILASMIILDDDGNQLIEKPTNDYGREPYAILVFDDLAGDSAYSNAMRNPLNSLACKQRHFRISSMHCVQALKSLPRTIRQQCGVMAIFPTKDETALMDICKENCSSITPDEFMKFYRKATDNEKHSFLLADFNSGTFRKNYDELLHIG